MHDENENFFKFIHTSGILSLDIENPGWENSRGYCYDNKLHTLYFKVQNTYLKGKDLKNFRIRIDGSGYRVAVISGELSSASNKHDTETVFEIQKNIDGWDEQKAKYALYDAKTGKPRKNNYKLRITGIRFSDPGFYKDRDMHEIAVQ